MDNHYRDRLSRQIPRGTWLAVSTPVARRVTTALCALAFALSAAPAIAAEGSDAHAALERGGQAFQKGDFDAAKRAFESVISAKPTSDDAEKAWVNLGVMALTQNQWAEALRCYDKATALKPSDTKAWNGKATALLSLGRGEDAGKAFEAALAANPRDTDTLDNLGKLALRNDEYEKAERFFHAALTANSGDSESHVGLAQVALMKNDFHGAEVEAKLALKMVPDHPVALATLGEALNETGDSAQAIDPLIKAIGIDSLRPELHLQLARAFYNTGRFQDAGMALADAMDLTPEDPRVHLYSGLCYYRLKDPKNADTEFDHALALGAAGHDKAMALYHKGLVRDDANRLDLAEDFYKQAEKADPKYAQPANNLGLVMQETHRLPEAQLEFKRALNADPDFDAARLNLGHVLIMMGQPAAAKAELEKLMSLPAENEIRERAEGMLADIKQGSQGQPH